MAGLVPAIHVFDALNGRSEGYQNGKALFLEVFAAGEANVKLVIETAVYSRDKPGRDGRGSETQPEPSHSTAIAL
jgi:hypothetical protein